MRTKRHFFIAVSLLLALSLQAQESNRSAQSAAAAAKNHHLEVAKHLDIFNQLYKYLDLMYVDTLDAE